MSLGPTRERSRTKNHRSGDAPKADPKANPSKASVRWLQPATQLSTHRVQKSQSPTTTNISKHLATAQAPQQTQVTTTRPFACPFVKRYPNIASCRSGWRNLARLKEHLYRKHSRPSHCPRCQADFNTENELASHVFSDDSCKVLPARYKDTEHMWLSAEASNMLRRRSKKGEDPAAAWKHLYLIIFPTVNKDDVPSPYFHDLEDQQPLRERIVRDFAQCLASKFVYGSESSSTGCDNSERTVRDVLSIIHGTVDAFLRDTGLEKEGEEQEGEEQESSVTKAIGNVSNLEVEEKDHLWSITPRGVAPHATPYERLMDSDLPSDCSRLGWSSLLLPNTGSDQVSLWAPACGAPADTFFPPDDRVDCCSGAGGRGSVPPDELFRQDQVNPYRNSAYATFSSAETSSSELFEYSMPPWWETELLQGLT